MSLRGKRRFGSGLAWTFGTCCWLLIVGAENASAAIAVAPELDLGAAPAGIALAVTTALLLVERYRRR